MSVGSVPSSAAAANLGGLGRVRARIPRLGQLAQVALIVGVAILAFSELALDRAIAPALVAGVLVALSAIDIERGVIPNRIVIPASGVVLLLQLALFPDRALEWLLAAIGAALLLAIPQLLGRSWMGMGDAKLALLIGAGLGWGVFGAIVLGFVCMLPFALLMMVRGGMAARKAMIPFGPFLSLGALIIMFGPALIFSGG